MSPSRKSPVRTFSTPTSVRPIVPVSLTPAWSGTSRPAKQSDLTAEEREDVGARGRNTARAFRDRRWRS